MADASTTASIVLGNAMSVLDELLQQIADKTDVTWRDETYDLARARGLDGTDRSTYIKKLMEVSEQGDTLAIMTLGHLEAEEALSMLQRIASSQAAWASTARRALVAMGHGEEIVDAIAKDVVSAPGEMTRIGAALDLAKIGGAVAFYALEQAMEDPDTTVRGVAWNGIVDCMGLLRYMNGPEGHLQKGSYLELLKDFLLSDVKAFNRIGATEMRDLVRRFAGGESPQELGISYTPDVAPDVSDAIIQAIIDPNKDYPVDGIAKLTGIPRRWGEAALALRAERNDPRVPPGLVRLDAVWTLPVLEELAQSTSTPADFRKTLTDAIRELKAS